MSKVFIIADTHFGSENIRLYENRPFKCVSEMNQVLTDNWNRAVSCDDAVWHLGDFCDDGSDADVLAGLNGIKYLVKGNHDTCSNEFYRSIGFTEVYEFPVIVKGFWIFSHEPLYVNRNMPYANIFGHVHGNPMYTDYSEQHFCVSAERLNYCPIDFQCVMDRVSGLASKKQ